MDPPEGSGLSPHARRAVPFIAAALAVIVVASLLYLRASAPPPRVSVIVPPAMSTLDVQYQAEYQFITPLLGWAIVGQSSPDLSPFWIFRTTDGAKTWHVQYEERAQTADLALHFFDKNDGILSFGADVGYAYRTVDGGAHWNEIALPPGAAAASFTDPRHFWVLASTSPGQVADQLMYSADAGASWQPETWPAGATWAGKGQLGLAFRSSGEGWVGTEGDQPVLRLTTDAGMTWSPVTIPAPPVAVPSPIPGQKQIPAEPWLLQTDVALLPGAGVVAFVTDYSGNSTAYASFDRGMSWRLVNPLPESMTFNYVSFLDSSHWWAMHFGFLFKTADAGLTWQETHVAPLLENWNYGQVNVIDSRHAWVFMGSVSRNGGSALSMTYDGGATWKVVKVPEPV